MDEKISFHSSNLLSTKNNHRNPNIPINIVQIAQYSTFHIVFLLVLRGVVNDGGVAGALGVLRVEVELDGDPGVEAGHLEDGDLVGHLPANQR